MVRLLVGVAVLLWCLFMWLLIAAVCRLGWGLFMTMIAALN